MIPPSEDGPVLAASPTECTQTVSEHLLEPSPLSTWDFFHNSKGRSRRFLSPVSQAGTCHTGTHSCHSLSQVTPTVPIPHHLPQK